MLARWRFLPGFDATGEPRPFTARRAGTVDRQTDAAARGHAELDGVADQVRGGLVGRADQRVLDGVAIAGFDHEASGQHVPLAHLSDRSFGLGPARIRDAIGRQRRTIDRLQQSQRKEPVRHTTFASGVQYMEFTEAVARSAASGLPVNLPLL